MSDHTTENDAKCGSFGCTLSAGHNIGRADVPENHLVDQWAEAWDVRPLIDARIRRAQADALREAAERFRASSADIPTVAAAMCKDSHRPTWWTLPCTRCRNAAEALLASGATVVFLPGKGSDS